MKSIFKYKLKMSHEQRIGLPSGAEVLSVQTQNEEICIWALVDQNAEIEDYLFFIVGTGHEITPYMDSLPFIGTVQQEPYVWHVFGGVCR